MCIFVGINNCTFFFFSYPFLPPMPANQAWPLPPLFSLCCVSYQKAFQSLTKGYFMYTWQKIRREHMGWPRLILTGFARQSPYPALVTATILLSVQWYTSWKSASKGYIFISFGESSIFIPLFFHLQEQTKTEANNAVQIGHLLTVWGVQGKQSCWLSTDNSHEIPLETCLWSSGPVALHLRNSELDSSSLPSFLHLWLVQMWFIRTC